MCNYPSPSKICLLSSDTSHAFFGVVAFRGGGERNFAGDQMKQYKILLKILIRLKINKILLMIQ